jgi:hypothetical protein
VTHGVLDLVLDDVEGVLRGGHALIARRSRSRPGVARSGEERDGALELISTPPPLARFGLVAPPREKTMGDISVFFPDQ